MTIQEEYGILKKTIHLRVNLSDFPVTCLLIHFLIENTKLKKKEIVGMALARYFERFLRHDISVFWLVHFPESKLDIPERYGPCQFCETNTVQYVTDDVDKRFLEKKGWKRGDTIPEHAVFTRCKHCGQKNWLDVSPIH